MHPDPGRHDQVANEQRAHVAVVLAAPHQGVDQHDLFVHVHGEACVFSGSPLLYHEPVPASCVRGGAMERRETRIYSEPEIQERLQKELPKWYFEEGWIRRKYKTEGWK